MAVIRSTGIFLLAIAIAGGISCGGPVNDVATSTDNINLSVPVETPATPSPSPTSVYPDLQAEIKDERFNDSTSPLTNIDFLNFSYPLPRGWQNPEQPDLILKDGKIEPVYSELEPDDKAGRRIGASFVSKRFIDLTGDGKDEAVVILKIETTGSAIPQIVYVYEWNGDEPVLIWTFRTGDRADGGLKDIRSENGLAVVELFGQDRFILGDVETGRISSDEQQLCCPNFYTKTTYKWNGRHFIMQGKRLTFDMSMQNAEPVENMGDLLNKK